MLAGGGNVTSSHTMGEKLSYENPLVEVGFMMWCTVGKLEKINFRNSVLAARNRKSMWVSIKMAETHSNMSVYHIMPFGEKKIPALAFKV